MNRPYRILLACCASAVACIAASTACAIDLPGVQPAALDQPRVNAMLRRTATGAPLSVDFGFGEFFNVEAFYDTGASGILLSNNTADYLGIQRSTHNGQTVVFGDVGVAGTDKFNVSEPLYMALAPYHPDADIDNKATYSSVYTQSFGPFRAQIGPVVTNPDPFLSDLDVFGMPAMTGKVVVMDPKPVNTFADTMRTYVYNPGTAYNPGAAESNPGIPLTNSHVKLSYASFDRFTTLTPAGATGPTLRNNPFIGPNPVSKLDANPPADSTPGVVIAEGSNQSTASFLLDTGAATSIISQTQANNLHVRYVPGTFGTSNPRLERYDPDNPGQAGTAVDDQFQLTVGGIGGTIKAAGFYLDSLLLPTMEANPSNPADPRNLKFHDAPVLVADITVKDPTTAQTLTLDGILGMNYFVATALVSEGFPPVFGNLTRSAFDWLVFDEPAGILGLQLPNLLVIGDMNGDSLLNNFDIFPFELAVANPNAYLTQYPTLTDYVQRGDVNHDGGFNNFDILPFEQLLTGSQGAPVPEPGTLALLACGVVGLLIAARHKLTTCNPTTLRRMHQVEL